MKKNIIIYIVAGAIVLAGLATVGVIALKKHNDNQANSTTDGYYQQTEEDFNQDGYTIVEPSSIDDDEPLTNENGELIEIVTDEDGNVFEAVVETDVNGEKVTDNDGNSVTKATKPATTTKKPSTTKKTSTTKKPTATKPSSGGISSGTQVGNNTVEIDQDGNANIVKPDGTIALSYSYDATGNYFYTDDDPWQRNFGFNRLYDIGAVFTFMFLDTIHVRYSYGDYDWMVQLWKGQYGLLFVGSEIGLYYKEPSKSTAHYNCAEEDMEIMMQMTLYRDGYGELFTRPYKSHWWITAFVPGKLVKFDDRSELTMVAKLTFKTEEECILFCNALKNIKDVDGNQFKEAGSISKNKPETFKRSGATVDLVWRNLDDDRKTPTVTTTTTKADDTTTTTKAPATTEPTTQAPTTTQPIVTEPVVVG